jgi:hypothetical protein
LPNQGLFSLALGIEREKRQSLRLSIALMQEVGWLVAQMKIFFGDLVEFKVVFQLIMGGASGATQIFSCDLVDRFVIQQKRQSTKSHEKWRSSAGTCHRF